MFKFFNPKNFSRKIVLVIISSVIFFNFGFFPIKSEAVSLEQIQSSGEKMSELEMINKASGIWAPFVQNSGQFDSSVKYSTRFFSGGFFVTDNNLTYSFKSGANKGFAIKEYFLDKDGRAVVFNLSPEDKAETVVSYFKGDDPNKWQSGLASYSTVSLGKLCKNIEIKLKVADKNIEKVFYVNPGGEVSNIAAKIRGVKSLSLAENGELIFKTSLGEFRQTKLVAYQEIGGARNNIEVGYELKGANIYGFKVGEYNKKYPLIIDPELSTLGASTFLGGSNIDQSGAKGIQIDGSDNVYVSGYVLSADFPTTVGAYDTSQNGGSDWSISKFNSSLTSLLASTFIGGAGNDSPNKMIFDGLGNLYVVGSVATGFPTTVGAYDTTYNGGTSDVAIAELDSNLTTLMASTFIGSPGIDSGYSINFDSFGDLFVSGTTANAGFPTIPGSYDTTYNLGYDGFVAKLNSSLSSLLASTFLGAPGNDSVAEVFSDSSGAIYVAGYTDRATFPTTLGAYDTIHNGGDDAFVSKFNNNLSVLSASTFLGGASGDAAIRLLLDSSNNIVVTGRTASLAFPTTVGAYDTSYNGGGAPGDMFISKFNSALSSLLASTFFGGTGVEIDYGAGIIDSAGNIYVTGTTNSADFPTTPGAYDTVISGYDAFVSKLNSNLTTLVASTFIGGITSDYGHGMALDSSENIYVAGRTTGLSTFPTTPGAYDTSRNGNDDAVVFYFLGPQPLNPYMKDTLSRLKVSTAADHTVEFRLGAAIDWDANDTLTLTFQSDFNLGVLSSVDPNDFDIVANGLTEETVVANGNCGASDAIEITSIAGQVITFTACGSYTPPGTNSTITIEIGTNATTGGTGDSQITNPTVSGTYTVDFAGSIGDTNSCAVYIVDDDEVTITATVDPVFTFVISSPTCALGTLLTSIISTCNYYVAVGTNASSGAVITIQDIDDGDGTTGLDLDSNPATALTNVLEDGTVGPAGTEEYGIAVTGGTAWYEQGDFTDDDTPIPTSLTTLVNTPGPVDDIVANRTTITHRASISATSPAGTYSQAVQYIATGTF